MRVKERRDIVRGAIYFPRQTLAQILKTLIGNGWVEKVDDMR
jgi:hypothetical protein